jgi:hypothetical protein
MGKGLRGKEFSPQKGTEATKGGEGEIRSVTFVLFRGEYPGIRPWVWPEFRIDGIWTNVYTTARRAEWTHGCALPQRRFRE